MSDLYARAKADNRRILNRGFHRSITLTSPAGAIQTVEAFSIDVNLDVDLQSGLPIQGRKIAASVHLSDLTIGDPTDGGLWRASIANSLGQTVTGIIESPDADRTLGMITFVIKLVRAVG